MSNIIGIGKHVICEEVKEEHRTASGLDLTDALKQEFRYRKAVVISAGEEVNNVKESDVIYYDKARTFQLFMAGRLVTVVRHQDIVGAEVKESHV